MRAGKKYNPLRQRAEPAAYPVDALLLGTILFVTLIFLFPTLLAFYLAFLSVRLSLLFPTSSTLTRRKGNRPDSPFSRRTRSSTLVYRR